LVSATAVANVLASRTERAWARANGTFVVHFIDSCPLVRGGESDFER
jgi:hypothetical protein